MRALRYVIVLGPAALMAGAMTLGAGSTATTAAVPARMSHAAYSARFISAARAALVSYLRHDRPQVLLAHAGRLHAGPDGATSVDNYNWSGYADVSAKAGTFTKVSGSWTTPSVTCSAEDEITAEWVGLDGAQSSDPTVEQDGTFSWCYEGKPLYFTWYEVFPTTSTVEVGTSVAGGDKIAASVSRSGSTYTMKLTDSTHPANSFTKTATCSTSKCLDETAEWVSERPTFDATGVAPQAEYNAFKLTSGDEKANGQTGTIGSFPTVDEFIMIDSTGAYDLATTSALTGGDSFSTTWLNSY